MAFEQTRDLRGEAQDSRRDRDHREKWAWGARPSAGVQHKPFDPNELLTGSESQRAKVRPDKLVSGLSRYGSPNIVKGRMGQNMPAGRFRVKADVISELQDPTNTSRSIQDLLPMPAQQRSEVSDNILYSFDRTETPGKPLSLDVFVKSNPRETEKFVEKEYEILDANGDALKGKKARQNLRRPGQSSQMTESEVVEDDGFELV